MFQMIQSSRARTESMARRYAVSVVTALMCALPARAQYTPPVRDLDAQYRSPATDSGAVARDRDAGLAWVVSPTRDMVRYATPPMCQAAVDLIQHQALEWTGWDTLQRGSRADTLTTVAATNGRQCLARFTAQNVKSRDLLPLMALALRLDNEPLALSALDRLVHDAGTPAQKGRALLLAVRVFRDARPARIAAAESLLARFSGLQGTQAWWKVSARHQLLVSNIDSLDTTYIRRLSRENFTAYRALPTAGRTFLPDYPGGDFGIEESLDALAGVPYPQRCHNMADAIIAWPQLAPLEGTLSADVGYDPTSRTFAEAIRTGCLADTVWWNHPVAPTYSAPTWFAPGSVTSSPAPPIPIAGHVTLLVYTDLGNGRLSRTLAAMRQLYQKYHDAGLELVLVAPQDSTHAWASPPLSPEDLAKTTAWYFHAYLQMPGGLIVTPIKGGRPVVMLFDRQGKAIRKSGELLEAFIRQALGMPIQ